MDRFRPNLVVGGTDPWEEDTWSTIRIGEAQLQCVVPWPRWTIPQIDQVTADRHSEPAKVLRRHRWCTEAPTVRPAFRSIVEGNSIFGVGCSIGPVHATIRIGDEITGLAQAVCLASLRVEQADVDLRVGVRAGRRAPAHRMVRRHTISPSTWSSDALSPARDATTADAVCSGWMSARMSRTPLLISHATRAVAASDAMPLPWAATPISHATSADDPSAATVACITPTGRRPSWRRTIQFSHASSPSGEEPDSSCW